MKKKLVKDDDKSTSNFDFLIDKMNNRNLIDHETFIYSVLEELCKKNNINQKYCPICGKASDFFLPYGENPRKNAQCPYCFSLERNRLLYLFFEYSNLIKSKTKILYIFPEYSLHNYFKDLKNIDYYFVDVNKDGYADKKIDLKNIKFKKDYFDIVILSQNTNFIDEETKCKELYDTLKNNGKLIFMSDYNENLKIVLKRLTKTGFKISESKYTLFADELLFEKYSLEKSSIFVCKKL